MIAQRNQIHSNIFIAWKVTTEKWSQIQYVYACVQCICFTGYWDTVQML